MKARSNVSLVLSMSAVLVTACATGQGRNRVPASSERETIDHFFANYSLISQGFDVFQREQSKLLSPAMSTVVRDHLGTHEYARPEGYFASLGDWSQSFSAGEDFGIRYDGQSGKKHVVSLRGAIVLTENGQQRNIPDTVHCWQELFSFDSAGRIESLDVNMNLKCPK